MFAGENALGICLLRAVFLTLILSRNAHAADQEREPKKEICSTPECVEMAKTFLKNMDQSVHPCEDFYSYACGNWEANNPRPHYALEWTIHAIMKRKTDEKTKELLLSILRHTTNGEIYRICLGKPYLENSKPSVIKSYVRRSKFFPMILNKQDAKLLYQPWWTIDNYYVKLTGESAFFSTNVVPNVKHGGPPMQSLHELISAYGSIFRLKGWDHEGMANYKNFLLNLVKVVSPFKVQEAFVWKELEKVMNFRLKLEEIINMGQEDESPPINAKSIMHFQEWWDKHTKKSVSINWLEIIRSLYGPKMNSKINGNTMINVARVNYFYSLMNLLKKEPEETIVNHIQLYFVERYTELDYGLRDRLLKATIHKFEPTGQIRYVAERWKSCLDKLGTDLDMATAYVDAVFKPKNIKDKVEKLFSRIKDVIKTQISESTWLDSNTKERSVAKITKTKVWCGYPEWYDKFSLKDKYRDIEMNPTVANAHSMLDRNFVLVNAAILQYPIYSNELPYVMTYASTGSLIAHELYHGFDEQGLHYNADGKYSKSFFPSKMMKLYSQKKRCIIDQYNSYEITELGRTEKPLKCDGKMTYNENVADIMGLKAAFALYERKKLKRNGACAVFTGFEKFSCDEFFFLAFANSLCGVISKELLRHYLELSSHALPRLRINGAVSNVEEFSAAYKCGPETPMNRTIKCDLWK